MKRWARMAGDVCLNTVEQETRPLTRGDWRDVTGHPVGPGSRWVDGQWQSAAAAVPASISMRQARLALLQIGQLASVEAAIDGMDEPARTAARITWDYSSVVERDNALVLQLGPALGLTSLQIDDLFRVASTL